MMLGLKLLYTNRELAQNMDIFILFKNVLMGFLGDREKALISNSGSLICLLYLYFIRCLLQYAKCSIHKG